MPLLLLLFLKAEKENFSIISCISIFITVLAGVFTTTMGTVFPPIIIGILALIFGIYNKNIKSIFKSFLCCIPSIVYGILYFVL